MINYDGLYNKEFYGEELTKSHFSDEKLHFQIFQGGLILPHKHVEGTEGFGGLLDAKGNFIPRSSIHMGVGGAYTPDEEIQEVPTTAIYLGMIMHVWGHCLTDNIKRLWFLRSEIFKHYFKKTPVVYTSMWKGIIPNFKEMLDIILEGEGVKLYAINQPTRFREVIFPDESFRLDENGKLIGTQFISAGAIFTQEYRETIDKIRKFAKKNFKPLKQKKYYFFYGVNQIGEERLAKYFQSKGYEIIRPENLTFKEQLNILMNCESFASTVGSCAHNIIFLQEHSEVILIPRWVNDQLNFYQEALNQIYDLNIYYIDSSFSTLTQTHVGPFCFVISGQLRKFFGDEWHGEYEDEDFKNFLAYMQFAKEKGVKGHEKIHEWHGNVLSDFLSQLKKRKDLIKNFDVDLN